MERSEQIDQLAVALAKAQGEIEGAAKDSANLFFRSKYADLASVWNAIREPLSKAGLSVAQPVAVKGPEVTVTTVLLHASGQWISGDLTLTAMRQLKDGAGWETVNTPQAIGSTITYARRYALAAMVGVAPEEDDGNAASGVPAQRQVAERRIEELRQPKPAAKPEARSFQMLEQFSIIKADLKKLHGDDKRYYEILGNHGYEKSSEIRTEEEGRTIYKAMKAELMTELGTVLNK